MTSTPEREDDGRRQVPAEELWDLDIVLDDRALDGDQPARDEPVDLLDPDVDPDVDLDVDWDEAAEDTDGDWDLEARYALKRVSGLRTELEDVSEVE